MGCLGLFGFDGGCRRRLFGWGSSTTWGHSPSLSSFNDASTANDSSLADEFVPSSGSLVECALREGPAVAQVQLDSEISDRYRSLMDGQSRLKHTQTTIYLIRSTPKQQFYEG